MKLRSLKPTTRRLESRVSKAPTLSDKRIAGRANQSRRFRLWSKSPYCVDCGRLTDYPWGFELDHDTPLEHGGSEHDSNLKVRCVWWDERGAKHGCHEAKTKRERSGR